MKRLVLVGLAVLALALAASAQAHPLGNFTVNRFSRIEVSGHQLYVRYVLDMAEIPTFQARQSGGIDAARVYARRIAAGLRLTVAGRPAKLVPVKQALAFPRGAGGLRTTRLEIVLRGPRLAAASRVSYRDTNFAARIGWKEIVAGGGTIARSVAATSSAPTRRTCCRARSSVTSAATRPSSPTDAPSIAPELASGTAAAGVPTASPTAASRA